MQTSQKKILVPAAAIIFLLTILYIFLILNGVGFQNDVNLTPNANLVVITSDSIPTVDSNLLMLPSTETVDNLKTPSTGIFIGAFVKIVGTDGSGLRIRLEPGKGTETIFVANDSEVFKVVDGPETKDGLVWWKLTAPYDTNRNGWAAVDYLENVTSE